MKPVFTFWNLLLFTLLTTSVSAQTLGDYRSKVSAGLWTNASSWQRYNGSSWVSANAAPTSADGVITIKKGDSIILGSAVTIDQVVVENGAVLDLFSNGDAYTVTLNDDASGDDIVVDGKLYISISATLSGTGSVICSPDGIINLRYSGTLAAPAVNDGTFYLNTTGTLTTSTFVNNGVFIWQDKNLNIENATFTNNDSLVVLSTANVYVTGSGTFNNAAKGVMYRIDPNAKTTVNSGVDFVNSGTIKGYGEYRMSGTSSNTGIISPGNGTAATLTINPFLVNSKSPNYVLTLNSPGNVAGANYQQIIFSTVVDASVAGATLTIDDRADDPVGTVYTIFTNPSANITGTFATVNLPATLGNLTYTANTITVTKTKLLPFVWQDFTAVAVKKTAKLTWTTSRETDVDHFEIQHSLDGFIFAAIGTSTATGNSSTPVTYDYTDASPTLGVVNYYRIKEIDTQGGSSYSLVQAVDFTMPISELITIGPNPCRDLLYIYVPVDCNVVVTDMGGRALFNKQLPTGTNQISLARYAGGSYFVAIFQGNKVLKSQLIVKF